MNTTHFPLEDHLNAIWFSCNSASKTPVSIHLCVCVSGCVIRRECSYHKTDLNSKAYLLPSLLLASFLKASFVHGACRPAEGHVTRLCVWSTYTEKIVLRTHNTRILAFCQNSSISGMERAIHACLICDEGTKRTSTSGRMSKNIFADLCWFLCVWSHTCAA